MNGKSTVDVWTIKYHSSEALLATNPRQQSKHFSSLSCWYLNSLSFSQTIRNRKRHKSHTDAQKLSFKKVSTYCVSAVATALNNSSSSSQNTARACKHHLITCLKDANQKHRMCTWLLIIKSPDESQEMIMYGRMMRVHHARSSCVSSLRCSLIDEEIIELLCSGTEVAAFVLGVSVRMALIRRCSIWTEAAAACKMMADKCIYVQENGGFEDWYGFLWRRWWPRSVTFLTLIDGFDQMMTTGVDGNGRTG